MCEKDEEDFKKLARDLEVIPGETGERERAKKRGKREKQSKDAIPGESHDQPDSLGSYTVQTIPACR